jgi:hypothetical protein
LDQNGDVVVVTILKYAWCGLEASSSSKDKAVAHCAHLLNTAADYIASNVLENIITPDAMVELFKKVATLGNLVWLMRIFFRPFLSFLMLDSFWHAYIEKLRNYATLINWVPIQYYSACILFRFCNFCTQKHGITYLLISPLKLNVLDKVIKIHKSIHSIISSLDEWLFFKVYS